MTEAPARPPLRLEYLDPHALAENPSNWKFHGAEQLGAIDELMAAVGWAGALLLNERTGRLVDGHGRLALARRSAAPVPVLVGDWSEEQERQILLFLDPTGWMATADATALKMLQDSAGSSLLPTGDNLAALLEAVRAAGQLVPAARSVGETTTDGSANGDPSTGIAPVRPSAAEVPNALWPTDNPWGVPVLDLALQADAVEAPVTLWGTQGQTKRMPGTWAFYSADSDFDVLWSNPGKVFPSEAPCLVEPNWSTTDQAPFAVALWGIYRRRWIARYWQSHHKRIFVDINVHHSLLEPHEGTPGHAPAFLGVPKGWRAFATRAHGNRPEALEAEHAAALAHSGADSLLFLVFGGGRRVEQLARDRGWAWVPEPDRLKPRERPSE